MGRLLASWGSYFSAFCAASAAELDRAFLSASSGCCYSSSFCFCQWRSLCLLSEEAVYSRYLCNVAEAASACCAGVALVSMDSTGKKELGAFEL